MTQETPNVDEREWPTHCPECGTELQSAVTGFEQGDTEGRSRGGLGEVMAVDYCPNEECPANQDSDTTLPGSLGGDNGGG